MARKKAVPVEEQEPNMEGFGLPETEMPEGAYEFPEGLPEHTEGMEFPSADDMNTPPEGLESEEKDVPPGDLPDAPPEDTGEPVAEMPEESLNAESTDFPEAMESAEAPEATEPASEDMADPRENTAEDSAESISGETAGVIAPAPARPRSDRQSFFDLDFNELDRDLTAEERQEWNSIYASYRGRSALTGTIIGVDPHSINIRSRETGQMERQTMYCAIVIPYRVRVVIPAAEMWEAGHERPDFVLQNMVGATIDFIITKVDRESGFAIGSRRLAARSQRYFFAHRPALRREGARLKCRILSVGPRRCLVECYGHDLNMTQRDLRYTAIPDLRNEYHPGQELDCVVKSYDPEKKVLRISVKETESNPFEGAELRHPAGSRRQAVIAGKYGGGVFCNLPDGTVCMCNYSYQHEDSDFLVGDTVILVVQRHERDKRQMYGKILSKW